MILRTIIRALFAALVFATPAFAEDANVMMKNFDFAPMAVT